MEFIIFLFEMFKTGLFAIGGGLATIPFFIEITNKYDFLTIEELTNMIAISESTPGPIGINISTYVGFEFLGIFGAIIGTFSIVLPSLIIICIVSVFYEKFSDSKIVKAIFSGIKPVALGLIISSTINVVYKSLVISNGNLTLNIISCIIIFILIRLLKKKNIHPIVFIGLGAVVGVGYYFLI